MHELDSAGKLSFLQLRFSMIAFWIIWVCGLLSGLYVVSMSDDSAYCVFRLFLYSQSTLFGLLLTQMLPLAFTCFIFWLSKPCLTSLFVYIKAFLFAYCAFGIVLAYGTAGWMIRWIILFSSSCSTLPLLWFWCRNFTKKGESYCQDLLVCAFSLILICVFDYLAVLPLAKSLVNY